MKQFAENQNKMILDYCTKLKIDPDVLEKQLKEIQMLKMIIKQKDEQIEKMKCCANCEWSMVEDTNETVCIKELEKSYVDSYQHGCNYWELRNDR